jgi:hypothetical protein
MSLYCSQESTLIFSERRILRSVKMLCQTCVMRCGIGCYSVPPWTIYCTLMRLEIRHRGGMFDI